MRYLFIAQHSSMFSVSRLCAVMGVSRRGYYSWRNRPCSKTAQENKIILSAIRRIFDTYRQVYGAPRIHSVLRDEGLECGLNRVSRLMRSASLVPKTIRKFRVTTDSRKSHRPAKNILSRKFNASKPNKKWVADVTYIPTREGWLFLATVLDLYSRKIVGWSMGERLTSQLAQEALSNAILTRQPDKGLLVHSDQGREYYAGSYQALLKEHGLICSMSRKGNCHDNAPMESFFQKLKVEQIYHDDYRTRADARAAVFDYIEVFYNRQRRHSSIDYLTPIAYEERLVA